MNIDIKWHKPVKLKDGSKDAMILKIDNLDEWNGCTGVYMFCRKYAKSISPLYIGKAEDIGRRIKSHLNSIKMMKGIQNSQNGNKVLLVGELIAKPGQDKKKCIAIAEKTLIEHALSEGYDLLNVQGTKTPVHGISFFGYQLAKNVTGKQLFAKAK